ncbi:MAG: DoxX family protein [Gemmatimonadota bacterium]
MIAWVLQGLLGAAFLAAGALKLAKTREELLAQGAKMAWVEDFSDSAVRGIGAAEVLGALGVVLPTLTGILPVLTPVAAAGLVLTMLGAAATHIRRGEYPSVAPNAILAALALGVIWLRM